MRKQSTGLTLVSAAVWIVAVLAAPPARAASELSILRLRHADLQLQSAQVRVARVEDAVALDLRVSRVVAPGIELSDLRWRCTLRRRNGLPQCSGPVGWRGGPEGRLSLRQDEGWQLHWQSGPARVDLASDAAVQSLRLVWQQLPLVWLQPLALQALPEGVEVTSGRLAGEARGDLQGKAWSASLNVDDAGLDSRDGLTAVAGLRASVRLDWTAQAAAKLSVMADIEAGELLYRSLYVPLLAGSRLAFALQDDAQGWRLQGPLRYSDPEAAEWALAWSAGPDESASWTLAARLADLSRSGPRYLDGPLGALGFAGAAFAGALQVEAAGTSESLTRLDVDAGQVTFADPQGVVVLAGLNGRLRWQAQGLAEPSELGWQALSLQGIALGPAAFRGEARDGVLEASLPLSFAPFGGKLSLFPLRVQPFTAEATFAAELADIRLAALSAQLGWPAFEGTLSGHLPAVRYQQEVFSSDGGLQIGVFGGRVQVSDLRWERPFGTAPSLSADIELDDLDLDPLTGAFGFGAISGRLDGYIRGLRMLDGAPVAFDAFLHTDDDWKGRRRISQKAVNDIGAVGGGVAAGLQQTVLSLFDTFGYKRIGLRCRLANNVCEMGGVEDLANGYVLIEGAGLPRVTVNGYRRRVDWPVLLARLQAAASGGGINVD
jgi:hypothetical protein